LTCINEKLLLHIHKITNLQQISCNDNKLVQSLHSH